MRKSCVPAIESYTCIFSAELLRRFVWKFMKWSDSTTRKLNLWHYKSYMHITREHWWGTRIKSVNNCKESKTSVKFELSCTVATIIAMLPSRCLTSCVYKCAFPVHVDFIDMSGTITEYFLMLKISRTTVLTIHNGICVIYIVFALMLPHSCAVLIFLIMMLCGVYDLIQIGDTAFHNAAQNGHIKVVDYLLSLQPNINVTNNVSQFIVL